MAVLTVASAAVGCFTSAEQPAPNGSSGGASGKKDAGGSSSSGSSPSGSSGSSPSGSSGSSPSGTSGSGGGGQTGSGSSSGTVDASASAVAGYSVSGPDILDPSGKKHIFRGVARPSLEWSASGDNLMQSDYDTMKAWGANIVRISLNQDFWISDPSNPNYDSAYADNVDQQVQAAESDGLDVILDLHWSDGGSFTQSPGQWCMADLHSVTFWTQVATKYMADPHVLFELYNEPYVTDWSVWQNGGATTCTSYQTVNNAPVQYSASYTVAGMQKLYDTVRATGAQNLVIIGGIGYAFDLSGVGQGHRINGSNIIYNTHPYNEYAKQTPSQWYAAFGYLAATDPVIATEFGDNTPATCSTSTYDTSIIAYFDTMGSANNPANRISWTAWAFYPGGCTFPSLLSAWTYATTASGAVVKASLQSFKQ